MLDASGTTTYTFDNNGNQQTTETPGNAVTTNTWDYENHLTVIEQPAVDSITYSFNPIGLRVKKDNQGSITKYLWDDQTYLLETDNDDVTEVVYSNGPSMYGDLISQRRSGNSNYLHLDGLDSTRELTASDELITDTLIYSAWGEEINRTGATNVNLRFVGSQGYYYDSESDFFYIRARYLNPANAKWLTADPAEFQDSFNLFQYSNNNPSNKIDPTGFICSWLTGSPPIQLDNYRYPQCMCEMCAHRFRGCQNSVAAAVAVCVTNFVWPGVAGLTCAGLCVWFWAIPAARIGCSLVCGGFALCAAEMFFNYICPSKYNDALALCVHKYNHCVEANPDECKWCAELLRPIL